MDLIVDAHNYSWNRNVEFERECSKSCQLVGIEWAHLTQVYADKGFSRSFASGKVMSEAFERMWHIIFRPDDASLFQAPRPQLITIVPAPEAGPGCYQWNNPYVFFSRPWHRIGPADSILDSSKLKSVSSEMNASNASAGLVKIATAHLPRRNDLEHFRKMQGNHKLIETVLGNACVILTGTITPHKDVSKLVVVNPQKQKGIICPLCLCGKTQYASSICRKLSG